MCKSTEPVCGSVEWYCIIIWQKKKEISYFPTFLASGFNSLPQNGFEPIASVICSLSDEIRSLRFELIKVRESNKKAVKRIDDLDCIKQDISDIKIVVNSISEMSSEVINPLPDNVNDQNNIDNIKSYDATLRTNLNENKVTFIKTLHIFKQL